MSVNKLRLRNIKYFLTVNNHLTSGITKKPAFISKFLYCTSASDNEKPKEPIEKLGFAKFKEAEEEFLKPSAPKTETFVSLLRNSKFIELGDPTDKVVFGRIYHVVGDDLYIDFGWKFPTVCTRPNHMKELYVQGARVKLLIKELELSTTFLGSKREISLNEADCVLLGVVGAQRSEKKETSKIED